MLVRLVSFRGRGPGACALGLLLILASCAVKLIADYDEKLDIGVTEIQRKVEKILTKIQKSASDPSKAYDVADYDAIREDLDVLRTRASSVDKNHLTIAALYRVGYALLQDPPTPDGSDPRLPALPAAARGNSLQERNQSRGRLAAEDLSELRRILDSLFQSVLRLELAKKRGDRIPETDKAP